MENGLTLYGSFIKGIKDLIYRRQYEAMKKVNIELIQLYWEIGGEIDRKQREEGWGKSVVEILAKELQKEFPGVRGFSARNLWLMRSFYIEYSRNTILQPSGAELPNSKLQPSVAEMQLKIGELIPEYVGKMQFILTALDDLMTLPEENPAIGIIICKSKNRMRVEYALKSSNKPIGVASYSFHDNLPEELRALLPSPDEIANIVRGIGGNDNDES